MMTLQTFPRFAAIAASLTLSAFTQAETPSKGDLGWPRQIAAGNSVITMYQPQVDSWKDYKELSLRTALSIRMKGESKDKLGVLEGTAPTVVDTSTRNVGLAGLNYTLRFPGADVAESAKLEQEVRKALPGTRSLTVALDRVLPYLDKERASTQKDVAVSFDPPRIFYSEKPAVLVMFMGEPSFSPVKDADPSLLYAANTNWDLFLSTTDNKYYLLNDKSWLESTNAGGWAAAKKLPAGLLNLPADENWAETRKNIPGVAAKTAPAVFQTTTPAELIITDGPPKMRPIAGTQLMQITNTPSLLFMSGSDQQYYFLVAGRWFRTKQLTGPWEAASTALPEDFGKIPNTDAVAEVRSAVQGTDEAQDAIMLASVPTMATVEAADATLDVVYEGEPKFVSIPKTQIQFAVNTAQDVFMANGGYYCCSEGVWFCASAPKGPWGLCKQVDSSIYTIPTDHPKHNVTYVNVYDTGPGYVTYGYTSGYTGSYVSNGLLVFGAGIVAGALLEDWLDDDDDHHYYSHYPAKVPYYSYGVAAHYSYGAGGYYGAAHHYGPYGGAGRYAAYNPVSGVYSRGAAIYGPYSSAGVRQAYNPWTDTYAARARVNTPSGSAGRFYAERDGESVWGGSRSGSQGSVGWAQSSEGGKGAAWDTRYNEGAAIKNKQGDVLVGNDGNIYKREDGNWQKYDDGSWNNVNRPDNARPEPRQGSANGLVAANSTSDRRQGATAGKTAAQPGGRGNLADDTGGRGSLTGGPAAAQRPANSDSRIQKPSQVTQQPTRQPVRQPAQVDRTTLDNLERQNQARARGNANTRQYQQARATTAARPTQQRQASSANRPASSAGRSQPAARQVPRQSSGGSRSRPSAGASRGGGARGGRR